MTDRSQRGVTRRDMLRITAAVGGSLAVGGGLTALLRSGRLHRVSFVRVRMGSPVEVALLHPDPDDARRIAESALAEMARLEGILSRYRADGPLAELAASGRLDPAPPELLQVLDAARSVSQASGGAFDVTIAPVLDLHREAGERGGGPLDEARLKAALARVGWQGVELTDGGVRLARPGMALTLDGIAKGFVLDRTRDLLRLEGAERVTVDAGGDLAGAGFGSRGWTVGVRDPDAPARTIGTFRAGAGGVATSGDYVHAFTADGRAHHLVDPRTGRSPADLRSVTVLAPSAMEADALATAAFILGPREGLDFIAAAEGVEGLLLPRGGEPLRTPGFPRLV